MWKKNRRFGIRENMSRTRYVSNMFFADLGDNMVSGQINWHKGRFRLTYRHQYLLYGSQINRDRETKNAFWIMDCNILLSGPNPKQRIRTFTNFLTNWHKSYKFYFYLLLFLRQKLSDLVKYLWKLKIDNFGIGCWIRWARYLIVNLGYLYSTSRKY